MIKRSGDRKMEENGKLKKFGQILQGGHARFLFHQNAYSKIKPDKLN